MSGSPIKTVLIVDDDDGMRETLATVLKDRYRYFAAESAEQALAILQTTPIDLVLADVRLPGLDGIALARTVKADLPDIEVIVLSVLSDIETAVQAIQAGAFNYLVKTFEYDTLHAMLANASDRQDLRRKNAALQEQIAALPPPIVVGGDAPAMRQVLGLVERVSPLATPLLITGETGTGKNLLAQHIHKWSARADGPFIEVHTGASEDVLEATLLGYEAGAIPGALGRQRGKAELASGGTLFLDEVADLTPALQACLLRILHDSCIERLGSRMPTPVDVRLIVATRSRLQDEVKHGRFRADLYYRLSGLPVHLPPLRERIEDVPALAAHFLSLHRKTPIERFSPAAIATLQRHDWPGNVRELRSLVERLVALHDDPIITASHLPRDLQVAHLHDDPDREATSFAAAVTRFEERLITRALERSAGSLSSAARELVIPLSTLKYKIRRYGLRLPPERSPASEQEP